MFAKKDSGTIRQRLSESLLTGSGRNTPQCEVFRAEDNLRTPIKKEYFMLGRSNCRRLQWTRKGLWLRKLTDLLGGDDGGYLGPDASAVLAGFSDIATGL
ncbi:CIC11C00000001834 [Sungouiella intermedia]|uniref:CIC11C00000001834 n=1 Tax=Sungouiella intermedia TaxID=45354 RepID=A0A1L0B6D8_9ASCO|nr:CIC11C00000001834 [[Candida] intermedia]